MVAALPLLAELLSADLGTLTDPERTDAVLALAKLAGQAEAALLAVVADWDGRTVWIGDGAPTAGSWLAARTEFGRQQATALVHLARGLRACPHVADAFAEGVLGKAKVSMLLRARTGVEEVFAEHEQALVAQISTLTVDHARVAIAHWRRLALATVEAEERDRADAAAGSDAAGDDVAPEEAPADEADEADPNEPVALRPLPAADPIDPEAANRFHLSQTYEGRFLGDLDLDAVSGTELRNAIDAEVDARFRAGTAQVNDGLTHSQRNAQALLDLVRRGAKPGIKHGEARPSVAVVIDLAELQGRLADGPADAMRRRCQLDDGTPIPRSTAERLMCEGSVIEILQHLGLDGHNHVVAVSSSARTASPRQRRALRERDQGCAFPGCHRPVAWTDAHHIDGYAITKRTELERLCLLCRHHHHLVHEGGFQLTRDRHGTITVTRPDGTLLPRTSPGRQTLHHDQGGPAPNPFQPPIDLDVPSCLEYAQPPRPGPTQAGGQGGGGGGDRDGDGPGTEHGGEPDDHASHDPVGPTHATERADRQHGTPPPPPRTGGRTPDGTNIDPHTWQRRPPSRFHTLTERQTAQQREQTWQADQIDAEYARLYAQAQALGMDLTDEPEPATGR